MGLDIGPESIKVFQNALAECKTIIWNGPMGVFEFDKFAEGTNAIATTLADLSAFSEVCTIIGGGDSVAAVEKAGLACLLYTSPSPRDNGRSRMPSSA